MALDALPCEHLFTIDIDIDPKGRIAIPGGPRGMRAIATVAGGSFDGPKAKGTVANVAAGDWVLVRTDGSYLLDVRLALVTDDGAPIYMTYTGIGLPQADGTLKIRTAPLFETGDERYAWINNVQCVAHGTTRPGGVVYDVYALL